jgi:hypothetical protein
MRIYELLIGEPWNFTSLDGDNRLLVKRLDIQSFYDDNNRINKGLIVELVNPYTVDKILIKYLVVFSRVQKYGIEDIENLRDPSTSTVNICTINVIGLPVSMNDLTFWAIGNINNFAA